jgi:hypothetical protein
MHNKYCVVLCCVVSCYLRTTEARTMHAQTMTKIRTYTAIVIEAVELFLSSPVTLFYISTQLMKCTYKGPGYA